LQVNGTWRSLITVVALRIARAGIFGCLLGSALTNVAVAQTVWSGLSYSFTRTGGVDYTLPENQDHLTANVWVTRAETAGLFNIAQESEWNNFSPADTEWATDLNNPGDAIEAGNWANLTFEPWIEAYGGAGGMDLPARLIGRDAVVHLITDDVYLNLRFTSWASAQEGGAGAFSYLRSAAVPEPGAIVLATITSCMLSCRRRGRRRRAVLRR
jgi:hypothetical protein